MILIYKIGRCRLKELLKKRGFTYESFGNRVGLSIGHISDYANNRHVMGLELARNIADELNCAIEDLYEWTEER